MSDNSILKNHEFLSGRKVMNEAEEISMDDAYAHCREIAKNYGKTFYMATRFLPHDSQKSIFAIYALSRLLDNIVDEDEGPSLPSDQTVRKKKEELAIWKENLEQLYKGTSFSDPVLMAFSDVIKKHQIPLSLPLELLEGVGMDLEKSRFETFEELYDYSYKVASVVGIMVSEVFGYKDKSALKHAEYLGIAMQLTNILRDVGEDLQRDRIYIPAEDLDRFGVTESALKNFDHSVPFKNLMRFQVERARSYYAMAEKGIPMLSKESQIPVYLAHFNYARILDRIEAMDYQVYTRRAYLSSMEKMAVLPKAFWLVYGF